MIGEKDCWNKGYGTEATRLVMQEAFETLGLGEVRLEVFTTMTGGGRGVTPKSGSRQQENTSSGSHGARPSCG